MSSEDKYQNENKSSDSTEYVVKIFNSTSESIAINNLQKHLMRV